MKAALLQRFGEELHLTDLADPVPGAGEIVARVLAVKVLPYMGEVISGKRNYPLLLPLVPGTGAIALVEKTGADATVIKAGDLIFCDPTVRARDNTLCPDILLQGLIAPTEGAQRLQGHFRHGAFAEKILLPLENAVPLGPISQIDPNKLAALGTLLVPYGGLLAAGLQAGQTIIINGGSGHFGGAGVAVAIAMGAARILATGRNSTALEKLTTLFGPRVVPILFTGDEARDIATLKAAAPGGADCLLDMLSPVRDIAPVRAALMGLRPGGTAALMGGVQADIVIPYSHVMRNGLTLRGQYMYPRHAPGQLVNLIASGLVDLSIFATTSFPLAKIAEAITHAAAHGGAFMQTVVNP